MTVLLYRQGCIITRFHLDLYLGSLNAVSDVRILRHALYIRLLGIGFRCFSAENSQPTVFLSLAERSNYSFLHSFKDIISPKKCFVNNFGTFSPKIRGDKFH